MKLYVKKLNENAKIPKYMTSGAAAMDLCACIEEDMILRAGQRALVPTGIAIGQEAGSVAFVFARSGLASKNGICLANGVGVIDSDYTGEIKVALINLSDNDFVIEKDMRIAQLALMRYECPAIEEVDNLAETERGSGGFGSTGR